MHEVAIPAQRDVPIGHPARAVFVVNVDWFFLSHRLPIARRLLRAGYDVTVIAGDTGLSNRFDQEGLSFIPISLSRAGINPLAEVEAIGTLIRLYRSIEPVIVHHVTIKPVIYGTIAAYLAHRPAVVNAISGFGYAFSPQKRSSFLRRIVEAFYRIALKYPRSRTIFQNPEDLEAFVAAGMVGRANALLIRGSGVDCERFRPAREPDGVPVVVLPARMLEEKGVRDFVAAARILQERAVAARFCLVGPTDADNPTAVAEAELRAWDLQGTVEWWGQRDDMPQVFASAAVVALPTFYREGLPKALLEAAASARPLVSTDIPGCREIVRHGHNGYLIPPRDVRALADAIQHLLADAGLRRRFGAAGRKLVVEEFTEDHVVDRTMKIYLDLLAPTDVR